MPVGIDTTRYRAPLALWKGRAHLMRDLEQMIRDPEDIGSLLARIERSERGITDVTRRIDIQAEQHTSAMRAIEAQAERHGATMRAIDKLEANAGAQKELRTEVDRRMDERMASIEANIRQVVAHVEEKIDDFIGETRKASETQREFSRRIAIIAITSALSIGVAVVGFLITRGFNAAG